MQGSHVVGASLGKSGRQCHGCRRVRPDRQATSHCRGPAEPTHVRGYQVWCGRGTGCSSRRPGTRTIATKECIRTLKAIVIWATLEILPQGCHKRNRVLKWTAQFHTHKEISFFLRFGGVPQAGSHKHTMIHATVRTLMVFCSQTKACGFNVWLQWLLFLQRQKQ